MFIMIMISAMAIYIIISNVGASFDNRVKMVIIYYFVFLISVILSFILHEWLHIIVSQIQNKEFHGYILAKQFTISIVKVKEESSLLSILLGPLVPSVLGFIFIVISLSIENIYFFLIGIAFIINILNLFPFTADGKGIIEKILKKKIKEGVLK